MKSTSKEEGEGAIASEARAGAVKHMQTRIFSYLGTMEKEKKIVRSVFALGESP